MTRHLIVSAIVVAIVAMVAWTMWGEVDPPTMASSTTMLRKQAFPEVLDPPYRPRGNTADAGRQYTEAFDLFLRNQDVLQRDDPPEDLCKSLTRMLVDASDADSVQNGFADVYVPMQPMARPEYGNAPQRIARVVLDEAREQASRPARARRAIYAVWTFGKRMFDANVRLSPRLEGLMAMQMAASVHRAVLGNEDPKSLDVQAWDEEVRKIVRAWKKKREALYLMEGNVGDLLRFAELDKDRSFRVEAVLQLGVAQWLSERSRANLGAIEACLNRHSAGDDPVLAEAATKAATFTRQQASSIR